MTVVADLHVHTTNSDGSLDPATIPAVARRVGLEAVAITDHDRYATDLDGPVVERDGITLINAIELRVEVEDTGAAVSARGVKFDLLGYGVTPTDALREEVDRLQHDRITRAAAMIERVEERLEVDLDLEPHDGIGRPHVARAIARSDAPYGYEEAFDVLIGDDGPCYVPRDLPSFDRGRRLLSESCALVGLAHPLRYDAPGAALAVAGELDAVERWYPYDTDVDHSLVDRAIRDHDLVPTGGSDAHDDHVGRAGLDARAYDRIESRLPEP